MKKLWLIGLVILMMASFASGTQEYQKQTIGANPNLPIPYNAGYFQGGFTFTTNASYLFETLSMNLKISGTPTFTFDVNLYAVDGSNLPTGLPLATTGPFDSSTYSDGWANFTWDAPYFVTDSIRYAIIIDLVTGTTSTSNYVSWLYDDTGTENKLYYPGSVWTIQDSSAKGTYYIYGIPGINLFELTTTNLYNSSSITNFNATFENVTGTYQINTTNGTIFWNPNDVINITISSVDYFNESIENYNTSSDLDVEMYQAIVYTYALESFTNSSISNFNLTIGNQFNSSSSSYTTHYVNADTYNYTAIAENYEFNSSGSITLSALQTLNHTIGFLPYMLNVTAKEFFTNSTISTFTIQVIGDLIQQNISTSNGWAVFYGVNDTYNVTIISDDYADESALITLNQTQNYTFYPYTTNSIYFRFFDEISLELIDSRSVLMEIISTIESQNHTTSNGTLYLDLMSPAAYTIRSSSDGYDTRFYEYTLTDNSNIAIDIYLVNTSKPTYKEISIQIFNQARSGQEDVTVKLLRYNIISNTYPVREIGVTNFDGYVYMDTIQYEEYYRLIFEYGGLVVGQTDKFVISQNSYTFQIVIGSDVGEYLFGIASVTAIVDYIDASNWFKYTYSDPTNQVTMACLEVYKKNILNDSEFIDSTCVNGTAGILYMPIVPVNETTFLAKGWIYFGSEERFGDSDSVTFSEVPDMGTVGIFICLLITLFILGGYAFSGNYILVLFIPLPTILFSIFNWIPVDFEYAVALEIAAIILALIMRRSSE